MPYIEAFEKPPDSTMKRTGAEHTTFQLSDVLEYNIIVGLGVGTLSPYMCPVFRKRYKQIDPGFQAHGRHVKVSNQNVRQGQIR